MLILHLYPDPFSYQKKTLVLITIASLDTNVLIYQSERWSKILIVNVHYK